MLKELRDKLLGRSSGQGASLPPDYSEREREIISMVAPFTMTSHERIVALIRAVHYLVQNRLPGAIVECGVWRGGSMLAATMALHDAGDHGRDVYLFDTFEGMPPPDDVDTDIAGVAAAANYRRGHRDDAAWDWCYASRADVEATMALGPHDATKTHLIEGRVEDTLQAHAPEQIALLRLDTDWYASTKHELDVLYPRLVEGGVLIIDDYGHWRGARKAVDEYILQHRLPLLLTRIDYTGRLAVKWSETAT